MVKIQPCLNALLYLVFGDVTNWEAARLDAVALRPDVGTAEVQGASVGI